MTIRVCMLLALASCTFTAVVPRDEVVPRCMDVSREELESCLIKLVNEMQDDFAEGLPEFHLSPIKELGVESFNVSDYRNEDRYLNLAMWDITVKGFDKMELTKLRLDYDNKVASWEVKIPEIFVQSKYIVNFKLSLITFKGQGTLWARLKGITGEGKCDFDLVGDDYHLAIVGKVEKMDMDQVMIHLNNLYPDNRIKREAAESFINRNSQNIMNLISPALRRKLSNLITEMGNKIGESFPLTKLPGQEYLEKAFNL